MIFSNYQVTSLNRGGTSYGKMGSDPTLHQWVCSFDSWPVSSFLFEYKKIRSCKALLVRSEKNPQLFLLLLSHVIKYWWSFFLLSYLATMILEPSQVFLKRCVRKTTWFCTEICSFFENHPQPFLQISIFCLSNQIVVNISYIS